MRVEEKASSKGSMFPFDIANLGLSFKRYFQIVPALTRELRDHAYRIRHEVYCEELKYEPQRPNRRESDEYDAHSLHCLIRSVKIGEFVGCTRLILCRPDDPYYPLPFERTCVQTLDRAIIDPHALSRHRIAEVSRLAVLPRFRTRRGERGSPVPLTEESFDSTIVPRFPYIPVALYLATTELAALHGIHTMFMLTEPRLMRHFAKLGVHIIQIGDAVEHRGLRVPSVVNVRKIIDGLNFIMRPLYHTVARQVREGMRVQQALERA
jgi:N-acyl amino acid synthase of PEP-CTERM/exosortase system